MAASSSIEPSVGFFGGADTRPHLFFLTVALESVRRFHPQCSFFALLPESEVGDGRRWTALLHSWSRGNVKPLALPKDVQARDFVAPGGAPYSSMTFHRHRVPQMLWTRGLQFSINLDPDVMCVRPWDLSVLLQVRFVAGREVGSGARTAQWLQERADLSSQSNADATENVTKLLRTTLNMTRPELRRAREINGGVIVFNNSAAAQLDWSGTFARYFAQLKHVLEGDQDLIGLVLAANPSFPRYLLSSVHNYAFRRDRERLPYDVARRLRHGLFSQQVINVHFVTDGKPWQQQNLTIYPMWLLAARLHYLGDWLTLARTLKPRLPFLRLGSKEQRLVGPDGLEVLRAGASRNKSLVLLTDDRARRRCRCFMRSLERDKKADPSLLLRKASDVEQPRDEQAFHVRIKAAEPLDAVISATRSRPSPQQARTLVAAQRGILLWACGGGQSAPLPEETRACDTELGENREKFLCALSAEQFGHARYLRKAANCSATGIDPSTTGDHRMQSARVAAAPAKAAKAAKAGKADTKAAKAAKARVKAAQAAKEVASFAAFFARAKPKRSRRHDDDVGPGRVQREVQRE